MRQPIVKAALIVLTFAPLIGIPLLASSCGSGGGSITVAVASPFAGSYSGNWTIPSISQFGTLTVFVDSNGQVTGSVSNSVSGLSSPLSGSVSNSGSFQVAFQYPGQAASLVSGAVNFNGPNQLVFSGNFIQGGLSAPGSFTLNRV